MLETSKVIGREISAVTAYQNAYASVVGTITAATPLPDGRVGIDVSKGARYHNVFHQDYDGRFQGQTTEFGVVLGSDEFREQLEKNSFWIEVESRRTETLDPEIQHMVDLCLKHDQPSMRLPPESKLNLVRNSISKLKSLIGL